jgi:phosphonate transport system substrate-binding protein
MIKTVLSGLACFAFSVIAGAEQNYVFAINEGITYRTGSDATRQNYKAIADDLSRILKGKVRIDVIGDYPTLEKDLAAKTYDIAFIHPTHIALKPVIKGTYTLVAVSQAHANYRASFLSKLGALMAKAHKPVGSPDSNSITAWLIRATLRDAAVASKSAAPTLKFTRYQDSIPFMIDNGFVDVAATASESIVKDWTAAGGKVIAASKAVPVKNIIVSAAMGKEATEAIKAYFIELASTADGQAKLERIGLKQGFVSFEPAAYVALGAWLGL